MYTSGMFVCKEGVSNKFWGYEVVNDTDVKYKWGRLGTNGQSKIKTFGSSYSRDRDIASMISEKKDKGYVEQSNDQLDKENEVAKKLGFRYKIDKIDFLKLSGDVFEMADDGNAMLVEVLNSWTGISQRLIINNQTVYAVGNDKKLSLSKLSAATGDLASAVRSAVKELMSKTVAAVKKVYLSFGLGDGRNLMLDGLGHTNDDVVNSTIAEVSSSVSFASSQVISKLASMANSLGDRALII